MGTSHHFSDLPTNQLGGIVVYNDETRVMGQQKILAILMTIAVLLLLFGCGETSTSATIRNGPSFLFDGSGRLASFRIYGPLPGHKIATPFDNQSLVWDVQPLEGYFEGAPVSRFALEYGIVPKGYVQTTPIRGAASALPTAQVYYFLAETTNAPPAQGFFYLDGNTPVEISIPDLCESGVVGEVKPLKCGTNEPYTEPTDLKRFVQENRVQK
jgi:hypothetical protein